MISLDDVRQAAARIEGAATRTPIMTSRAIDSMLDATVLFKCENLQRGGAFKFRGAYNTIASMSVQQRAEGVFAFSSGNHAQAVALAARTLGIDATILMPHDAPSSKVAATKGYGAEVVTYDRYTEDRAVIGAALAAERGLPLIPPFDDERIMAGQGTCALELLGEVGEVDMFITPLGGGGLLSGCATVVRELSPAATIVGVEPVEGDDMVRSLAAGKRIRIPVPRTIADGLQTEMPGVFTFPVIQSRVDEVVTVTDDELVTAMRLLFERTKMVVEPSGAAALAAMLAGRIDVAGKRVAVVLSGGNVSADRFAQIMTTGA